MFTVETNETKSFFSHKVYKINEVSILLSNQSPNDGNQMNRLASLFNFNIEHVIDYGVLKPKNILEYILEIFPSYSGHIQMRSYPRDILASGTYDLSFFLYDGKFKSDNNKSLELKSSSDKNDKVIVEVYHNHKTLNEKFMKVTTYMTLIECFTDMKDDVDIIPEYMMDIDSYIDFMRSFSFRKSLKPAIQMSSGTPLIITKELYSFVKGGILYEYPSIVKCAADNGIELTKDISEDDLRILYTILSLS